MPDLEDSSVSRRVVLRGAAGAGAAGIAASALSAVTTPAAEAATTPARASSDHHASSDHRGPAEDEADETIVVHVRDAAAGEIDIYRGTTQTRLLDRELAARLVRASR